MQLLQVKNSCMFGKQNTENTLSLNGGDNVVKTIAKYISLTELLNLLYLLWVIQSKWRKHNTAVGEKKMLD